MILESIKRRESELSDYGQNIKFEVFDAKLQRN